MTNRAAAADRLPEVIVRRRWNATESLPVAVDVLWGFHFQNDAGGVCRALPRAFLGARVWCDKLNVPGDASRLGHLCREGPPPHELVVCILPNDNPAPLYAQLLARARR
jgi:hypothetical protein